MKRVVFSLAVLLACAGASQAQFVHSFGSFRTFRLVTPFVGTTQVVTPLAVTGDACGVTGTVGAVANAVGSNVVATPFVANVVVVRNRIFVVRNRGLNVGKRNVVRVQVRARRR